jgi:hypothetical protein
MMDFQPQVTVDIWTTTLAGPLWFIYSPDIRNRTLSSTSCMSSSLMSTMTQLSRYHG